MSKPQLPKRLYKYRSFNARTLRLLIEAEVYYADPSSFNDPLDSRPTIQIDVESEDLENLLSQMLSVNEKNKYQKLIGDHRYMSREYGSYNDGSSGENCYKRRLASNVKDILYKEFCERGVLSLSEKWDCPLMWSHYADEHRGLCIEYDMTENACKNLRPVDYRMPRSIKISDLIKWKINLCKSAEQVITKTFFFAKAPQWRYEREWRDVLAPIGSGSAPANICAIHFGLRCDSSVITTIVNLYSASKPHVKFYEMYPKGDSFLLKRRLTNTEEIIAAGVKSSVLLELRDVFISETGT